ncbi:MAG: hypothetical protein KAW17_01670 [Candidatus Eisenbacteria sp.]|nr:hypothetical protein [Candidatus Eisenbacteria bacterium]
MTVVEAIEVEPQEDEILRLLRRGKTRKDPGAWTLGLIRQALDDARVLSRARGVYGFFDSDRLPNHPAFESAIRVGLCICTIGPDLEDRVAELMREGELVRGVVLDAVGSEMTEAAARVLDDRMEAEEGGEGLRASARFSPGYAEWELEGQRLLFDVLDGGRIDVGLSDSMMMKPRKSVSFGINFGPNPKPPRCATLCSRCDMEDCRYRRE